MIIKSTSRKDVNFSQIIAYLHKEKDRGGAAITYIHNIDSLPDDLEGMVQALEKNDQYRRKRKNGVGFYHDIISFAPKDSEAIRKAPWLLRDLIEQYIRLRCPDGLAVARVHLEEEHIHIHVVISANERESNKSTRISKTDFDRIKTQLRTYRERQYPVLKHSYQKPDNEVRFNGDKPTALSVYLDRIGRKQTKKAELCYHLLDAVVLANTPTAFIEQLERQNISIYQLGEHWGGVVQHNRKYRFSTLLKVDKELSIRQREYYLRKLRSLEQEKDIARVDSKLFDKLTVLEQGQIATDVQRLERGRSTSSQNKSLEQDREQ